jgi:ABC-type multidrug transport system ATPase subunit
MADDASFLVADRLARAYGATVALDGVDLAVPKGGVLAVLGPNGCGKTTTVRIFATLLRADSGRALVGGHDVVTSAGVVRAMIGLAGQYAAVDPFLTGRENLELVAELRHLPPGQYRRDVDLLLERLGLAGAARRLVRAYSGGMRRRPAPGVVARAAPLAAIAPAGAAVGTTTASTPCPARPAPGPPYAATDADAQL